VIRSLALGLVGFLWSTAAVQAQSYCRLALILAMDISSSVSDEDFQLQQSGLASALLSQDVVNAIFNGGYGYVSLAVFEWSGRYQQDLVLDWTPLVDRAALDAAVYTILNTKRSYREFPTAIGNALGFGAEMFERVPTCTRKVIDVSGDGVNNEGLDPNIAFQQFALSDVTVNGLGIAESDPDVAQYYNKKVLHGPLRFLEVAKGFADFERAMTQKLLREISELVIGVAPLPIAPRAPL